MNFRLTQEELENLKMACLIQGARTVSDFARGAVLRTIESHLRPEAQLQDRFASLDVRIGDMESALKHMLEMMRGLLKRQVQQEGRQG